MRIVGLDIGTKRIGIAVSDETGTIAQGKGIVSRTTDKEAILKIKEIATESKAEKIVVGLPLNMDGTKGERAEDSIKFAQDLEKETGLGVVLWDERLSTKEVEDVLIASSVSRKKRKKVTDKLAAQIILQNYLDSHHGR
jgi:putative Holliday junction resolvase